jgi:hypothetical protein
VFPFTMELRRVFEDQHEVAERLKHERVIPRFVFCYTAGKKTGKRITPSGIQ